jgi:hypothetical protein
MNPTPNTESDQVDRKATGAALRGATVEKITELQMNVPKI